MLRLLLRIFILLPLRILFLPVRMLLIAPLKLMLLLGLLGGLVVFLVLQAGYAP
ncbi:hypothetical protein [Szabonella alba]|uniref:Uncharacterized protein n=1 Tax=Szabonella alba TaxID=2804194 RepID=A0A8K0XZ96_9RHOB|nr:hypothetical protein [Szabonella alba]MBL4916890.1 hypothetical protein [Szabonella alba]